MSRWFDLSNNANKLRRSYVQGFLDVSGGMYLRSDNSFNLYSLDEDAIPKFSLKSQEMRIRHSPDTVTGVEVTDVSNEKLRFLKDVSENIQDRLTDLINRTANISTDSMVMNDISINDTISVGGIATMNSDLHVVGDVSLDSTLVVGGTTTLNSTLHTLADVSFDTTLSLGGNAALKSQLEVDGAATFNSTAAFNDTLHAVADASFDTTLTVNGATTLKDRMDVTGDVSLNNHLQVAENATFDKKIIGDGDASLNAALRVAGATNLETTLGVDGAATMNSTLAVYGDSSINNLVVNGTTTLKQTLDVEGVATFENFMIGQKNVTLYKNLEVYDNASFGGHMAAEDASFNGSVHATGDMVADKLNVNHITIDNNEILTASGEDLIIRPRGNASYSDDPNALVRIIGDLTVDGSINFTGAFIKTDTVVRVTEQVDVSNSGSGPAMVVTQHGAHDIFKVMDDTEIAMIVKDEGLVGIGTFDPKSVLGVSGGLTVGSGWVEDSNYAAADGTIIAKDKLGVGIAPQYALDVSGTTRVQGAADDVDAGINTYMIFGENGGTKDFVKLRQLGNLGRDLHSNALAFDFHKDPNDANFYVRSVDATAGTNAITTRFAVKNDKVGIMTDAPSKVLDVVGDVGVSSTLDVTGKATLSDELHVIGDASFDSNVAIGGSLILNGGTTFNDELTVGGLATFQDAVQIDQSLNVTGTSNFTGAVTMEANAHLQSDLSLDGVAVVNGATSLKSTLEVTGATTLSSTLAVTDATTLSSTLDVTGKAAFADNLDVSGNAVIDGTLNAKSSVTVDGTTTLNDHLTAVDVSLQALHAADVVTFASTLGVTGATTLSSTLDVTGKAALADNLDVSGSAVIDGTLLGKNNVTFNKDLTIGEDLSLNGNLSVGGTTALKSSLEVTGTTILQNNVTVNGGQTDINGRLQVTQDISAARVDVDKIHINENYISSTNGSVLQLRPGATMNYNDGNPSEVPGQVRIIGNLLVDGSVNVTSGVFQTIVDTTTRVHVTEQLDISNSGTGPAIIATQHGDADVASFYDDTTLAMIIKGGTTNGGYVGINTSTPGAYLDVSGTAIIRDAMTLNSTINVTGAATFQSNADFQNGVLISNGDLEMTNGYIHQVQIQV